MPSVTPPLLNQDLAPCCAPGTGVVLSDGAAERLAHLFKALSEASRVKLISLIATAKGGEACACDLTEPVGLSAHRVAPMRILVDAGLVIREQHGKWAYYRGVDGALVELARALTPA